MNEEHHAPDCDCVLFGLADPEVPETLGWVEHAWHDDADYCTCRLKERMARRAVYGDERLVADLPFASATTADAVDPDGGRVTG